MDLFWLGGEGPKEVPWFVHYYLVNSIEVPADKLFGLYSLQKKGYRKGKPVTFFRIYNPSHCENIWPVKDFNYLDQYPEFILYEGYWEKVGEQIVVEL